MQTSQGRQGLHVSGLCAAGYAAGYAALCALALATLAGCASQAPGTTATGSAHAPTSGKVLGRNEHLLIYQSAPGETLGQIAASFLGSQERAWVIGDYNHIGRPDPARPLVVPLTQPNPMGVYSDRYQTVPILCYHRFGANGSAKGNAGKMTVSATAFAAQLAWLAQNDYHVLKLSQLEAWLAGKQALPLRSVVITVDDGYESFYRHAFPLLKKYGFAATLFVYTDFVGAADAVNWAELQELVDSGLVSVQAHSRTHRNLIERQSGESDESYTRMLASEVRTPRELIERKLHTPQPHYAYPYGDANEPVLDMLASQHFALAVTVNPGGNGFFAQPLMLHRTMIFGDMSLDDFKARLQISRMVGAR
jgi:peptidoglycan/xylan/chitin deacetylase (PgdA/CDA1 family)